MNLLGFWKSLKPWEKIIYGTFVVSTLATICAVYLVIFEGKETPAWYVP